VKLRQQCKEELEVLARAARDYRREEVGGRATPATVQELLGAKKNGAPRYTGSAKDPWGNDYVIEVRKNSSRWQVRSLGQDGTKATDDDLVLQEPRG
jgi:hypothetical protein